MADDKNKLSFNAGDMEVEYWAGDGRNPAEVRVEVDAFHTNYDRDYGTEERITGSYDMKLDEAKELYDFLGRVLATEDDYEYAAKRVGGERDGEIVGGYWADKADREMFIIDMIMFDTSEKYKLVRRRKVGPVEDAS